MRHSVHLWSISMQRDSLEDTLPLPVQHTSGIHAGHAGIWQEGCHLRDDGPGTFSRRRSGAISPALSEHHIMMSMAVPHLFSALRAGHYHLRRRLMALLPHQEHFQQTLHYSSKYFPACSHFAYADTRHFTAKASLNLHKSCLCYQQLELVTHRRSHHLSKRIGNFTRMQMLC